MTLSTNRGMVDDHQRVSGPTPRTMMPRVISKYWVTGNNSLYQKVKAGMFSRENISPDRMMAGISTMNTET